MEQLVSKITTEILKTMQNQGGVSASFNTAGSVAGMIDHTLLKQNASEEQIKKIMPGGKGISFFVLCA